MRTRVVAGALAASGLIALAGCGNGAVSSSTSLAALGKQMAAPAAATARTINDTGAGELNVQDDATKDRTCPGGHRRVYQATAVVPRASGDDEKSVRNLVNLAAQAELKPSGAKVTTDLGSSSSTVPATIDFANSPSDKAEKRTYRTHVTVGAGSYTWRITGKTACVKG
jgi:hypothetical protein